MLGSLQFAELERPAIYTFRTEPFILSNSELTSILNSINSTGSLWEFVAAIAKG